MGQATAGESGIFKGLGYRGNNVIAAYDPLTSTRLGQARHRHQKNCAELFAPIRRQLHWGLPALLLLVSAGAVFLRF